MKKRNNTKPLSAKQAKALFERATFLEKDLLRERARIVFILTRCPDKADLFRRFCDNTTEVTRDYENATVMEWLS